MVCSECGKENGGDSKFCKECGTRLTAAAMPAFFPAVGQNNQNPEQKTEQVRRLLEMAFWHSDSGNAESAIRACRAVLAIDPDATSALSLLGCLYEREGNIDGAIDAIERVVALNPGSVADAEKLDLLRNGYHPGAVQAPSGYRWIPPALSQFFVGSKYGPMYGAAAASVLVLAFGFSILHMVLNRPQPVVHQPPAHVVASTDVPAPPAPEAVVADSTPVIPGAAKAPSMKEPIDNGDPPANFHDSPIDRSPFAVRNSPILSFTRPTPPSAIALPPYRPGRGDVAKLPSVENVKPIDFAPRASTAVTDVPEPAAVIPQHLVPVSTPAAVPAPAPRVDPSPQPPQRIEIHFYSPDDPEVANIQRPARSSERAADMQSKALKLQSQGDYSGALSAYKGAISAYKAELASGKNVDFAKRGIDACETGVQICKQSQ